MTFFISGDNDLVRLKSYSANVTGKSSVLKITVEVTDTFELGMLLRGLERIEEEQKARKHKQPAATTRPSSVAVKACQIDRQVMLALPAPRYDNGEDA